MRIGGSACKFNSSCRIQHFLGETVELGGGGGTRSEFNSFLFFESVEFSVVRWTHHNSTVFLYRLGAGIQQFIGGTVEFQRLPRVWPQSMTIQQFIGGTVESGPVRGSTTQFNSFRSGETVEFVLVRGVP